MPIATSDATGYSLIHTDWENIRSAPAHTERTSRPKLLRSLWRIERRKQFRCQIITAAIYTHPLPNACELRVFLGDEGDNNQLHSELARWDFTPLEEKATSLREVLLEKGWMNLETLRGCIKTLAAHSDIQRPAILSESSPSTPRTSSAR